MPRLAIVEGRQKCVSGQSGTSRPPLAKREPSQWQTPSGFLSSRKTGIPLRRRRPQTWQGVFRLQPFRHYATVTRSPVRACSGFCALEVSIEEAAVKVENDFFLTTVERRNGLLFCVAMALGYFAAPVTYVGMTHATLCERLGASATVSNLPVAFTTMGLLAPFVAAWLFPYRLERAVVVWCAAITSAVMAGMAASLLLSKSSTFLIVATITVAFLVGILGNVQMVYLFQSLKRGTSELGRTWALKVTYTVGPMCAVAGSLTAQGLLGGRLGHLEFPLNFAALFLIGVPCALGTSVATSQMKLVSVPDKPRLPFLDYLRDSFAGAIRSRALILLSIAYIIYTAGICANANLVLYGKYAMATRPELMLGYMLAFRFGFKSIAGYCFGLVAQKRGNRTTLVIIHLGMMLSVVWAAIVTGHWYLLAFAFMGASELGGAYFPNYCMSLSSYEEGARNLSLITLVSALSIAAPPVHGVLADLFGFRASFAFTFLCGVSAIWLLLKIPSDRKSQPSAA